MSEIENKTTDVVVKPKAKLGRPRKEDIKKAKAPIGRPKNDTGRIAEFKQRLLGTSGENVIKKIIEIVRALTTSPRSNRSFVDGDGIIWDYQFRVNF